MKRAACSLLVLAFACTALGASLRSGGITGAAEPRRGLLSANKADCFGGPCGGYGQASAQAAAQAASLDDGPYGDEGYGPYDDGGEFYNGGGGAPSLSTASAQAASSSGYGGASGAHATAAAMTAPGGWGGGLSSAQASASSSSFGRRLAEALRLV